MSMMIVSQDKRKLINYENVSGIYIGHSHTIIAEVECGHYTLGKYDNEDQTLKVLDDIQDGYCKFYSASSGIVYTMPQPDDEMFKEEVDGNTFLRASSTNGIIY